MEATWTIRQLTDFVNDVLDATLGDRVWVEGEIVNMSRPRSGHVYFSLIDPDDDGPAPASLGVTLFKGQRHVINAQLRQLGGGVRPDDGVRVRICGTLGIYAAQSKLQLRMTGIDPLYTLGAIEQTREAVLRALAEEGALERQGRLIPAFLPQRIGLITSKGSAAHADVMAEFETSEVGLQLVLCDARVQGTDAAAQLTAAIRLLDSRGLDLICVVRGGGARTDLVAFDDPALARAIASCVTPVWTGIGHEIDRSIADEVAHTAHKTPTACAAEVVAAAARGRRHLEDRWIDVGRRAEATLDLARHTLDRSATSVASRTAAALSRADHGLDEHRRRLGVAAASPLARQHLRLDAVGDRLALDAPRLVARAEERLTARASSVRAHDPRRILARGFSITRGPAGVVRRADEVTPGEVLVTTLADGSIRSVAADPPEGNSP